MRSKLMFLSVVILALSIIALPAGAKDDQWRIRFDGDPNSSDEHPWGGDHYDGGDGQWVVLNPVINPTGTQDVFMGITINYYWMEIKSTIGGLFIHQVQNPGGTGRPSVPPSGSETTSGGTGN